jgi:cullin 1
MKRMLCSIPSSTDYTHLKFVCARWALLEHWVERILASPEDKGGMDMKIYMQLYTAIHDYCTKDAAAKDGLPHGVEDFYQRLRNALTLHVRAIRKESEQCSDDTLLKFYTERFHQYSAAAKCTDHLFRFLNRHWITRVRAEERQDIYPVKTLHLVLWRTEVATNPKLVEVALGLIERHRNGANIDEALLKDFLGSFGA